MILFLVVRIGFVFLVTFDGLYCNLRCILSLLQLVALCSLDKSIVQWM